MLWNSAEISSRSRDANWWSIQVNRRGEMELDPSSVCCTKIDKHSIAFISAFQDLEAGMAAPSIRRELAHIDNESLIIHSIT
jgi:hypothetical protein